MYSQVTGPRLLNFFHLSSR